MNRSKTNKTIRDNSRIKAGSYGCYFHRYGLLFILVLWYAHAFYSVWNAAVGVYRDIPVSHAENVKKKYVICGESAGNIFQIRRGNNRLNIRRGHSSGNFYLRNFGKRMSCGGQGVMPKLLVSPNMFAKLCDSRVKHHRFYLRCLLRSSIPSRAGPVLSFF